MTNTDAIKWLENLKKDIGELTHQSLWHYEQALVEIIDLLADCKTEPQTTLCRECDDYAGDGMYCASNYLVYDFSISIENCEKERNK